MNILTTFLLILLILLILYSITIKKCGYCLSNMNYYEQVLPPIKKSTPDVIFLDTPKDKSYNKFCKICKKIEKLVKNRKVYQKSKYS